MLRYIALLTFAQTMIYIQLSRVYAVFMVAQKCWRLSLNQRVGARLRRIKHRPLGACAPQAHSSPPASTLKILVTFMPRVTIFSPMLTIFLLILENFGQPDRFWA